MIALSVARISRLKLIKKTTAKANYIAKAANYIPRYALNCSEFCHNCLKICGVQKSRCGYEMCGWGLESMIFRELTQSLVQAMCICMQYPCSLLQAR